MNQILIGGADGAPSEVVIRSLLLSQEQEEIMGMGKEFTEYGMKEIIRLGFSEFGLDTIYWNILRDNARAIRFYEKNGYKLADKDEVNARDFQKTSISGMQPIKANLAKPEIRFQAERSATEKTEYRRLSIPLCWDGVCEKHNGQLATNERGDDQ